MGLGKKPTRHVCQVPLSVREAVQPSSKRRPSQTLNDFAPFLSVKDMQCLRDENIPTSVKIDCIVTRMLVLGLHLPTEPTVKAVAGAAMAAGLVCSTAVDGLTLVREIKRRLKQNVKSRAKPANHVVEYPSDPSLLPDSIREVWHTSPMTRPLQSGRVRVMCRIVHPVLPFDVPQGFFGPRTSLQLCQFSQARVRVLKPTCSKQ